MTNEEMAEALAEHCKDQVGRSIEGIEEKALNAILKKDNKKILAESICSVGADGRFLIIAISLEIGDENEN